ncbi:glycogen debranching protein [Lyngbya confervoides]|uniref:Glycogen debranching protein n=1 Tax=Lyngbya confervoides BDU141951 TaxID=1574623 RepID=A0ABD4T3R4_9CYAN|nr:glycogen debranching protein [Lyngbya confervoides]MCM1982872.1 glycogen debranching protein [Lyngbya confervoides BDU141951]
MAPSGTIWVNEQLDPSGLLYACIACHDQSQAQDCHQSFVNNLTDSQRAAGWTVRMRTVESWDEVPVSALKLSF